MRAGHCELNTRALRILPVRTHSASSVKPTLPKLPYTSLNFDRTPLQSKCLAISSASRKAAYMNRAQRPVLWVRNPGCVVGTQERHVGVGVVWNSSSFQVVV